MTADQVGRIFDRAMADRDLNPDEDEPLVGPPPPPAAPVRVVHQPFEHHYFDCECTDFGHVVKFTFDPTDGQIWIFAQLPRLRLRDRLKHAWRILAGREYAGDECIVQHKDIARIRELLDRSEAHGGRTSEPRS